ncbi:hypothetical protein [Legionella sp. 16cNR16C]|nr:hypothetical protein [Legionella sp. 16cNR16C]MCE3045831.1 hypothetical protein [Legionella sp. 16cNR16C]
MGAWHLSPERFDNYIVKKITKVQAINAKLQASELKPQQAAMAKRNQSI